MLKVNRWLSQINLLNASVVVAALLAVGCNTEVATSLPKVEAETVTETETETTSDSVTAPELSNQTIDLTYSNTISGTISFTTSDATSSQISIINTTNKGTLTLLNSATGAFKYEPTATDAWQGDTFTAQVSRSGLTSAIATITLAFTNTTTPTLSLVPLDGATAVNVDTDLTITSDLALNASTLTYSTSGTCTGSVQVSEDNFVSCIAISSITEVSNTEFTAILSSSLSTSTDYTWRVSSDVESVFGVSTAAYEQTFTTDATATTSPALSDQTLNLAYSNTINGVVSFDTTRSPASQLAIISTATKGTLTLIDAETGDFQYEPTATDAWEGDSFTAQLSRSGESSSVRTITLEFYDSTVPSLSLLPTDGSSTVSVDIDLTIRSDIYLDASSLTYTSNTTCSGSVQVSADGFSSCLAISSISEVSNTEFLVDLSASLTTSTDYTWRVSSDVESVFGVNTIAYEQEFTTAEADGLLISEVGSSYYSNTFRWFEVYNPGSTTQDLSDFELRSLGFDWVANTISNSYTFSLPTVSILPSSYLVIRAQSTINTAGVDTDYVVHIEDGNYRPYWGNVGFIELLKVSDGSSVDFVTFGNNYAPTGEASWSSEVTIMPSDTDTFGTSIGRDETQTDTDTAADWELYQWPTLGGPNDVCGSVDADGDLIPDCNEQPGTTFAGMPLYDWGARAGTPDIFVEIDYIDSTNDGALALDEGVVPRKEALENVVAAFEAQGFGLHIDIGDLFDADPSSNSSIMNMGGGSEIPYALAIDLSPSGTQSDFYDYKAGHFDYSRLPLFHYAIFGTTRNSDGSAGSSGVAELIGNDLLVTLGSWGLSSATSSSENTLINYQAGTFMHELGHNLGLYHGGDDSVNDKPNYLSIMNYIYQLRGLPDLDNNPGDRYYSDFSLSCATTLVDGPSGDPANFRLDYSDGSSIQLDPTSLNETEGLGRTSATANDAVDYDCDGDDTETSVNASSTLGNSSVMNDHDDWGNIVLDFGGYSSLSNDGQTQPQSFGEVQTNSVLTFKNKVKNDNGAMVYERTPPETFFESIRQLKERN